MGKRVIITGASGMVGELVLKNCLANAAVDQVVVLVRKQLNVISPKLKQVVHGDYLNYEKVKDDFKNIDAAFFCIGVYTGTVPKDEFRKITVDYPVAFGKLLKEQSPNCTFCLLSGQDADQTEKSRVMFARDKGAAENQLMELAFGRFHTFRPGYIYPVEPRKEPNFSYKMMRALYKPLAGLMGKKFSVRSTELADAMVTVGLHGSDLTVLENKDILQALN